MISQRDIYCIGVHDMLCCPGASGPGFQRVRFTRQLVQYDHSNTSWSECVRLVPAAENEEFLKKQDCSTEYCLYIAPSCFQAMLNSPPGAQAYHAPRVQCINNVASLRWNHGLYMPPDEIIYNGWPITDELLMSHHAVYCAVQDDYSRGCSEMFH